MILRPVNASGDILPVLSSGDLLSGPEAAARLAGYRLSLLLGEWWENPEDGFFVPGRMRESRITEADVVVPAIQSAIYHYVIDSMDIGDDLNVPQLYGLLYQAAGEYASTFAVTDMSCSGNHGVSREKVIANLNEMFTIVSTSEVRVIVSS